MTKEQALDLIKFYGEEGKKLSLDPIISEIYERWKGGSEAKAMRWLGFCQGWLVRNGTYTLEDVKIHSMNKVNEAPNQDN